MASTLSVIIYIKSWIQLQLVIEHSHGLRQINLGSSWESKAILKKKLSQGMDYIRQSTMVWLLAIATTNSIYSLSQFLVFDLQKYMQTYYSCKGKKNW